MKSILFITEGDPCGISYEILQKSLDTIHEFAKKHLVVLVRSQDQVGVDLEEISLDKIPTRKNGFYSHSTILDKMQRLELGVPSNLSGKISYNSLLKAIELQKKFGGNILTLPLSKEWVIRSGVSDFIGHTETLAKEYSRNTFMLMYSQEFSVLPLTTHIPITKVSEALSRIDWDGLFASIQNSILFQNPRIGLCGLNPHAGEGGKMGTEEINILNPVVEKFTKNGFNISFPISADSIFQKENRSKFDIILACYHDQGLIPFKALVGMEGVNITLGLDFVRISPDHGTAYSIAGKNLASPKSVQTAIQLLERIYNR
ncbi:MAG: 4-hydroxythreonine-4-phosphate dehydrogenase PdxA [Leptospiraceae bacterium]|nr:4-hydroxythreonine-4-phosphate dehydrogenase PdxA [Leptospiraceae bacterium]